MRAATWKPDPQVIAVLVKAGAKIDTRGPQGWTALFMAAYNNPNPQVVIALLKAGADPIWQSRLRVRPGQPNPQGHSGPPDAESCRPLKGDPMSCSLLADRHFVSKGTAIGVSP